MFGGRGRLPAEEAQVLVRSCARLTSLFQLTRILTITANQHVVPMARNPSPIGRHPFFKWGMLTEMSTSGGRTCRSIIDEMARTKFVMNPEVFNHINL